MHNNNDYYYMIILIIILNLLVQCILFSRQSPYLILYMSMRNL